MARCTSKEKKRWVEELADLIVNGHSQRMLNHHIVDIWGLSQKSARLYILEVTDLSVTTIGMGV